jgi:hypothetical protein
MPNPSIMVNVSLAVIACLGVGVAFVFAKVKEPWERLVPVVPAPGTAATAPARKPEADGTLDAEDGAATEDDDSSADEPADDSTADENASAVAATTNGVATTTKDAT